MIELKIGAAVAIFLAGLIGGLFAAQLTRSKSREAITGLANTFAGGVFLGAALMHMLPDAREKFEELAMETDYPIFAFAAAAGFLLVLMLNKMIVPAGPRVSGEPAGRAAIYPYLLMLTLSVHSVITGIGKKQVSLAATLYSEIGIIAIVINDHLVYVNPDHK